VRERVPGKGVGGIGKGIDRGVKKITEQPLMYIGENSDGLDKARMKKGNGEKTCVGLETERVHWSKKTSKRGRLVVHDKKRKVRKGGNQNLQNKT